MGGWATMLSLILRLYHLALVLRLAPVQSEAPSVDANLAQFLYNNRQCTVFQSGNDLRQTVVRYPQVVVAFSQNLGPGSSLVCSDELVGTFPTIVFGVTSNVSVAEQYEVEPGIISPSVIAYFNYGQDQYPLPAEVLDDYIHVYGQNAAKKIIHTFLHGCVRSHFPPNVYQWSKATSNLAAKSCAPVHLLYFDDPSAPTFEPLKKVVGEVAEKFLSKVMVIFMDIKIEAAVMKSFNVTPQMLPQPVLRSVVDQSFLTWQGKMGTTPMTTESMSFFVRIFLQDKAGAAEHAKRAASCPAMLGTTGRAAPTVQAEKHADNREPLAERQERDYKQFLQQAEQARKREFSGAAEKQLREQKKRNQRKRDYKMFLLQAGEYAEKEKEEKKRAAREAEQRRALEQTARKKTEAERERVLAQQRKLESEIFVAWLAFWVLLLLVILAAALCATQLRSLRPELFTPSAALRTLPPSLVTWLGLAPLLAKAIERDLGLEPVVERAKAKRRHKPPSPQQHTGKGKGKEKARSGNGAIHDGSGSIGSGGVKRKELSLHDSMVLKTVNASHALELRTMRAEFDAALQKRTQQLRRKDGRIAEVQAQADAAAAALAEAREEAERAEAAQAQAQAAARVAREAAEAEARKHEQTKAALAAARAQAAQAAQVAQDREQRAELVRVRTELATMAAELSAQRARQHGMQGVLVAKDEEIAAARAEAEAGMADSAAREGEAVAAARAAVEAEKRHSDGLCEQLRASTAAAESALAELETVKRLYEAAVQAKDAAEVQTKHKADLALAIKVSHTAYTEAKEKEHKAALDAKAAEIGALQASLEEAQQAHAQLAKAMATAVVVANAAPAPESMPKAVGGNRLGTIRQYGLKELMKYRSANIVRPPGLPHIFDVNGSPIYVNKADESVPTTTRMSEEVKQNRQSDNKKSAKDGGDRAGAKKTSRKAYDKGTAPEGSWRSPQVSIDGRKHSNSSASGSAPSTPTRDRKPSRRSR